MRILLTFAFTLLLVLPSATLAGPFSPEGIAFDDSRVAGWATSVSSISLGPEDITDPLSPTVSFGTPSEALGPASTDSSKVISLGDGGSITLGFDSPITDIDGPDFAVFENPFEFNGLIFGELAFVEVSTNGVDFVRFPAVSLTQTDTQLGAFGGLDPTEINNLAGKNLGGVGTPFDLAELAGVSPSLDINDVNYVRLVDVVGSIDPAFGTVDSLGNLINEPFPTDFESGGFDLDGVAVLRPVPEPAAAALLITGLIGFNTNQRRRKRALHEVRDDHVGN